MTAVDIPEGAAIALEVAVSRVTGKLLLRVEADGAEVLWAAGIRELVIDLGREDLLVVTPDGRCERRSREA